MFLVMVTDNQMNYQQQPLLPHPGYPSDQTDFCLTPYPPENQAHTGELTGLPNRRCFMQILDKELALAVLLSYFPLLSMATNSAQLA
jgi:GGDEF domain-containing protein